MVASTLSVCVWQVIKVNEHLARLFAPLSLIQEDGGRLVVGAFSHFPHSRPPLVTSTSYTLTSSCLRRYITSCLFPNFGHSWLFCLVKRARQLHRDVWWRRRIETFWDAAMQGYSRRTRGQPFNLHLGLDQSVTPLSLSFYCRYLVLWVFRELTKTRSKRWMFKLEMHSGTAECWLPSQAAALKPL